MLRTGDILLAEFPYSNQSESKRRPVVLISRFREDLLVAYFTREASKYGNETTSVLISQEDIRKGKIRATSVIRVHKLAVIEARLCRWVAGLGTKKIDEILRKLVAIPTTAHFENIHKSDTSFIPGKSRINYAARVYDEKEMINLVDSALDFWLTTGKYAERVSYSKNVVSECADEIIEKKSEKFQKIVIRGGHNSEAALQLKYERLRAKTNSSGDKHPVRWDWK